MDLSRILLSGKTEKQDNNPAQKRLGSGEIIAVIESKITLLAARQANKLGDEVLRQGIRLYSESQQTKKTAD